MIEEGRRYPLLRRRRRGRASTGKATWRLARVVAMLVVIALVLAAIVLVARRASRPDPNEALRASFAALKRGNYSAARNHALVAADGPDAARGNAVLGRAYLLLGDGAAAEGALNRAIAAGMPRARLHQLLADAYLLQGNADGALAEAARAAPRYGTYAARVRARALATKGDVPGATALLATILSGSPNDAGAWADLGRIRMAAGDVAAADLAARRAIALAPTGLDAIVLSGEVVRSRYGLTAALPWFGRALELDAYYLPALIQYAATAGDAGRYTGMLQATRRALAARPNHPQALYLQAVMAARAHTGDCIACASGADRFKVEMQLRKVGLLEHFEGRIFSGHETPRSKPAPDVYLAAMAHLGVEPAQCLVIEDTAPGATAGVAAGATVWGLCPHGDGRAFEGLSVQRLIRHMGELAELL